MDINRIKASILGNKTALGIELGSTRIKAVLIDEFNKTIASGSYDWSNRLVDQIWTYDLDDVWQGIAKSYEQLKNDVMNQYSIELVEVGALGVSAMMHGYLVFDEEGQLLVPFRTWRNNITDEASKKLTQVLNYPIPQRWSIAHLFQAVLNKESHVKDVSFMTTLAGYVHWKLTDEKVIGIGDASGMFPIDLEKGTYNESMCALFDSLDETKPYSWQVQNIMPKVLYAGQSAGRISLAGAKLLDPSGKLVAGIPMCPPEGDAGTGMVATNSVKVRTGNVSAGTSVFAMIVLEKELKKVHAEIDLVTTPSGKLVAMAHSNNCTTELNAWVSLIGQALNTFGVEVETNKLFEGLYNKAMEGDADCGGLLSYGYHSGEHMTHFDEGRPLLVRQPDSKFNLANLIRVNLYTALGALKTGLDILIKEEDVQLDSMLGHGGLFKTERVGQQIMADALGVPVSVMDTAGEGGAWGIALLASYLMNQEGKSLDEYLKLKVFKTMKSSVINQNEEGVKGFEIFMERYHKGLGIEKAAVDLLK